MQAPLTLFLFKKKKKRNQDYDIDALLASQQQPLAAWVLFRAFWK